MISLKSRLITQRAIEKAITAEVENCTGVGYYFARRLHRVLKVPIGLVDVSWGRHYGSALVCKGHTSGNQRLEPYFDKFETALNEWEKKEEVKMARRNVTN